MSNFTVAAILNPDAPALRTYPDLLLSLDHLPSSPYERVWAWILWSFVKHALAHMSESDVLCLVRTAHDGQSIHTRECIVRCRREQRTIEILTASLRSFLGGMVTVRPVDHIRPRGERVLPRTVPKFIIAHDHAPNCRPCPGGVCVEVRVSVDFDGKPFEELGVGLPTRFRSSSILFRDMWEYSGNCE